MPWHAIRGIRNLFAHEYITMDKARVWETACADIPKLLLFCSDILEKSGVRQEQRKPEQKPSVLERLRKNQNIPSENRHPTKKKNNEPEL